MSVPDIAFWIVIMVTAFIGFLGLQLRFFAGMGLKIAASEQLPDATRREKGQIVMAAVGGARAPELADPAHAAEARRLAAEYPRAVQQIRLGRPLSLAMMFAIAVLLVARRVVPMVM